jgi:hypothetical protein
LSCGPVPGSDHARTLDRTIERRAIMTFRQPAQDVGSPALIVVSV